MIRRTPLALVSESSLELPRNSASALMQVLDLVSDGVVFLDAQLNILEANKSALARLGQGRDSVAGLRLAELLDPAASIQLTAASLLLLGGKSTLETISLRQHSETGSPQRLQIDLQCAAAETSGAIVAVMHSTASASHPSEEAETNIHRDYLTGLPTRALLAARLRRAERRARKQNGRYAVLFIDIDQFKHINDQRGHDIGDQVLQGLAKRLLNAVRPGDLVARFGGDEFVIVVEDIQTDRQVERLARRIRAAVNAPMQVDNGRVAVRASVGRAIGDAESQAELVIRHADRLMYRVKRARRNRSPR